MPSKACMCLHYEELVYFMFLFILNPLICGSVKNIRWVDPVETTTLLLNYWNAKFLVHTKIFSTLNSFFLCHVFLFNWQLLASFVCVLSFILIGEKIRQPSHMPPHMGERDVTAQNEDLGVLNTYTDYSYRTSKNICFRRAQSSGTRHSVYAKHKLTTICIPVPHIFQDITIYIVTHICNNLQDIKGIWFCCVLIGQLKISNQRSIHSQTTYSKCEKKWPMSARIVGSLFAEGVLIFCIL